MDALTQKLIGLSGRFARLKWDEQDHPRADDGKFGSGGSEDDAEEQAVAAEDSAQERRATIQSARDDLFAAIGENDLENSLADRVAEAGATWNGWSDSGGTHHEGLLVPHEEYDGIASVDRDAAAARLKDDFEAAKALTAEVADKADQALADLGERGILTEAETAELQTVRDALVSRLEKRQAKLGKDSEAVLKAVGRWEKAGDPGAYDESDPASVSRHERWGKASADLIAAADRQQLSLSNLSDAADFGKLFGKADRMLRAHQSAALTKSIASLRDRFARLKGSDWSEQDHPRADDGKFGEGGGSSEDDSSEETPHEQAGREWGERAEERSDRREYLEETQSAVDDWEETNRQGTLSVDAAGEGVKTGTYDHDEFRAAINEHLAATVKILHDVQNSLHTIGADADDLEAFDSLVAAGKKDILAAALAYSGTAKKTAAAAASLAALTETEPDLPDEPEAPDSENLPPEPDADDYDDGEDDEAYQAAQEEYESATAAHEAAEKAHDDWENECAAIEEQHAAKVEDAQTTLDELGEALSGHAAAFDEAVTGLIAAAQETAAAILDGARDDLDTADTADPQPIRKPSTVAPWEGDTTASKLLHLRDRFRKLLKWDEFHHPRDDDGKFGSGGGGGASDGESKPAAKPAPAKPAGKKPAAKKPTKPPKADAAKVHAGIADLLASGEPLNATHVARIATALQGLTVKEIQAVKVKLGLKASGNKAELAQSIAAKAVASVKAKPAAPAAPAPPPAAAPASAAKPPPTPTQAIPAVHPAAIKLRDSLKAAKNLSPEQQAKHAAAIDTVIKRMPRAALDRLAKHVDSVDWHATTKDLTADLAKTSKKVQEAIGRGATVNGCYRGGDQKLVLNGDVKRRSADDIWHKDRENAHETYAHEMAHAVDGPKFEHSHSPEWVAAWKEEIGDVAPAPGQAPKLSKYATSVSHEGWAEFGRLVYGTSTDHAKIAAKFPKCFAYWKKIGVV